MPIRVSEMLASVNQRFPLEKTSQTPNISWEEPDLLSGAVGGREPCTSAGFRGSNLGPDPQPEISVPSLTRRQAVCGSLARSEQPRGLGACAGAGGMLGGRNLWVKPLHVGQRSWVTPFPEGNFPAQAPLGFALGPRHIPHAESRTCSGAAT